MQGFSKIFFKVSHNCKFYYKCLFFDQNCHQKTSAPSSSNWCLSKFLFWAMPSPWSIGFSWQNSTIKEVQACTCSWPMIRLVSSNLWRFMVNIKLTVSIWSQFFFQKDNLNWIENNNIVALLIHFKNFRRMNFLILYHFYFKINNFFMIYCFNWFFDDFNWVDYIAQG